MALLLVVLALFLGQPDIVQSGRNQAPIPELMSREAPGAAQATGPDTPTEAPADDAAGTPLRPDWDCPDSEVEPLTDAERADIVATLADADDPDLLVAASMLVTSSTELVFQLLQTAERQAPGYALVQLEILRRCAGSTGDKMCRDFLDLERGDESLAGNGAAWLLVALNRRRFGDTPGVLDALRRAASAPSFDTYYAARLGAVIRALDVASPAKTHEQLVIAMGEMNFLDDGYMGIVVSCRDAAEDHGEWASICADVGRRMYADAPDMLSRIWGLDLQKFVYTQTGHQDGLLEIEEDRERVLRSLDLVSGYGELVMQDDAVVIRFLEDLHASGEAEAFAKLGVTIARLQADPDYNPCVQREQSK